MYVRRFTLLASLLLVLALMTVSCSFSEAPAIPLAESSTSPTLMATAPGVAFLPPVGRATEANGSFDPRASLTIEFFRVRGDRAIGGPIGPSLRTADGSVTVDGASETGAYVGVWSLRASAAKPGDTIRAEVRTRNATAGVPACDGGADLDGAGCLAFFTATVWRDQRQANRATGPEGMIHLVANQTLPIRLFVATGAANLAPSLEILEPDDGSVFPSGSVVVFAGTAHDPEDGDLSAAIAWRSDLDGALGVGERLDAALSDGVHEVTALVQDGDGRATTATVTVQVGVERISSVTDQNGAFFVMRSGPLVSLAPGFVPPGTMVEVTSTEVYESGFREGVDAVGPRVTVSVPASAFVAGPSTLATSSLRTAALTWNQDCDTVNDCLFVNLKLDRAVAQTEIIAEVSFNLYGDFVGATREFLGSQTLLVPAFLIPGPSPAEVRYGARVTKSLVSRIGEAIYELNRIPPERQNSLEIAFVPALIRTKVRTPAGTVEGLYRIGDGFTMSDFDAACARPLQHQIPSSVHEITSAVATGARRPLVLVHGWSQITDLLDLMGYALDVLPVREVFDGLVKTNPLTNPIYPFSISPEALSIPMLPRMLPQVCMWKEFLGEYLGPDGAGLRDAFELYSFGYDSRQSIGSNAAQLRSALNTAFGGGPAPTVVAHSTGGLMTHAAMLNGASVQRLITLGSPFLGAQSVTCSEASILPAGEPSEFYRSGLRCDRATVNPQITTVVADAITDALEPIAHELRRLGINPAMYPMLAVTLLNTLQGAAANDAGTQDLTWFEPVRYEVTELVSYACVGGITGSIGCSPRYETRTRTSGPANPFTAGILTQSGTSAFDPQRITAFAGDRLPTREPARASEGMGATIAAFYDGIALVLENLPSPVDSDGFITLDSATFQPGGGRPEIPSGNRRVLDGYTHSQLAGVENFVAIRNELLARPVDVPLVGVVPGAFSLTGGQFTITVSPRDASNAFVEGNYRVEDFSFRFIEARQVSLGRLDARHRGPDQGHDDRAGNHGGRDARALVRCQREHGLERPGPAPRRRGQGPGGPAGTQRRGGDHRVRLLHPRPPELHLGQGPAQERHRPGHPGRRNLHVRLAPHGADDARPAGGSEPRHRHPHRWRSQRSGPLRLGRDAGPEPADAHLHHRVGLGGRHHPAPVARPRDERNLRPSHRRLGPGRRVRRHRSGRDAGPDPGRWRRDVRVGPAWTRQVRRVG
jgi:hypothetical protein